MGALFSCCCGEEEDSGSDAGERTRLIRWIWAGALVMTNDELLISSQIDYTFQEYLPFKDQTYQYHAFYTASHLALIHLILHSLSDGPGYGGTLVPDGLHCEGRDGLGGLAQVFKQVRSTVLKPSFRCTVGVFQRKAGTSSQR